MSIEAVIAFGQLKETDPQLYGGIAGFCIGAIMVFVAYMIAGLVELSIAKKNKKVIKATDLVGEEVTYSSGSITVAGQVVSVDYDLGESGEIVTTVYIDVDDMDEYFQVDYGKNGEKIKLKGAEDEQREAD